MPSSAIPSNEIIYNFNDFTETTEEIFRDEQGYPTVNNDRIP